MDLALTLHSSHDQGQEEEERQAGQGRQGRAGKAGSAAGSGQLPQCVQCGSSGVLKERRLLAPQTRPTTTRGRKNMKDTDTIWAVD